MQPTGPAKGRADDKLRRMRGAVPCGYPKNITTTSKRRAYIRRRLLTIVAVRDSALALSLSYIMAGSDEGSMTGRRFSKIIQPGYLYLGCHPPAPSGMRSKKCQTLQKSSPGANEVSATRMSFAPWRLNTETPGRKPLSPT
jgi:hypothetical protein